MNKPKDITKGLEALREANTDSPQGASAVASADANTGTATAFATTGPRASGKNTNPFAASVAPSAAPAAADLNPRENPFKQDLPKSGQNMGGYSPQMTPPIDLTRKSWEATNNRSLGWSEDPKSRLAIRMFSRGVLGAAFFTAGGILTKKWMTGENAYHATESFSQQKNPLQVIAKLIDTVAGKPIETTVAAVAGKEAGLASVRFRSTRYTTFGKEMRGRSLGDEAVNITFDFFCASIGDAWGRDIAGIIDPNTKKTWIDDKGNINVSKAVQQAITKATRYVTYNGGEDWAVAIPYAYFMKGQRELLDRATPGFKYDFDRQLNGGSFRLKDNQIVGNYNKTGMADLQSRFTVYNIGTLMYREAYDYAGQLLKGKDAHLYGSPEGQHEHKNLLGQAGDLLKWTARSAIKGTIIMTPSVPLFWMTRTPQTKHRGLFIDPEKGMLGRPPNGQGFPGDSIHANTPVPSASTYVDYWQYQHMPGEPVLTRHRVVSPGTNVGRIDPTLVGPAHGPNTFNAHARSFGPVDSVFNGLGKANYDVAHAATIPARWIDDHSMGATHQIKEAMGITDHTPRRFVRPMVYAAASYTPYMYAKAEFANLWDNGKMDLAAERLIDGAAKLNWGEFKKGVGEVYNSVLYRPLADPKREVEAQRRMLVDTSPADVFVETQAEQVIQKQKANWRDRVISGPPVEKQVIAAHDEKRVPAKKASYAEQEAMRKALEELTPPTNSIN